MQDKIIDFSKYSSIKIGPKLSIKIAQNINEAIDLYNSGYFLIGKANNIIFSPKKHKIFQLGMEFNYIKDLGDYIEIGARSGNRKVFLYFKEHNLSGLEFLGTIPGSIGGIVKMNAGMKQYEIKNIIQSVCIDGKWEENINFSYRNSNIDGIISAVRFKKINGFNKDLESSFKIMRINQPKEPSAGSCFKNPKILGIKEKNNANLGNFSAGKLLDLAGFRGYRIGNMKFSQKHANFLINLGNGSFKDAIKLIELAKSEVLKIHNITLECEVIII
ncbi:UDP-N-acetylmuramate dehydrogenase [Helicobacter sp. MIT 14-3879]|uniref:UDP-N-acetylmuramate dehydrogenase n=1 Tax=Helicobacter sp. MIT 14-3879 TaxID=2040649 RepID=UPI000E1E85A7|nr:UDP-N-acetylmuramate dehydrogenase [Helicobacter sp. MIT 14-3879]RDU63527.1 UDP-N-acetylmuramate dehydrogenase [Helicobacter sp. MIT 14-3879]